MIVQYSQYWPPLKVHVLWFLVRGTESVGAQTAVRGRLRLLLLLLLLLLLPQLIRSVYTLYGASLVAVVGERRRGRTAAWTEDG